MILGLINPQKGIKNIINMNENSENNVFYFSASCTMLMIYACGVISTGFFIVWLCSKFSPLSTPYLPQKTGTHLRYINRFRSAFNVWTLDDMRRDNLIGSGLTNGVTDSVA